MAAVDVFESEPIPRRPPLLRLGERGLHAAHRLRRAGQLRDYFGAAFDERP
jgi:hypothetical protein